MRNCVRERCNLSPQIKGVFIDEVWRKDPKTGKEELVQRQKDHNVITQPFTILVPALLANDPSLLGGILQHAIGEGDPSWDSGGVPTPSKFDTKLFNELDRRAPDGIVYLKYGEGRAQSGTTIAIIDPDRIDDSGLNGRFEPDDFFVGMQLEIIDGTNKGEIRTVVDYTQATGEIIVDTPFPGPIDNTSYYQFVPVVSTTPTNVIEVRTTWDYGDPSDPVNYKYIREQGLFGGTATSVRDSGYMVDRITHVAIWKEPVIKLIRFIQLLFRI